MGNASTAAAGSSDLLKIEQKGAVLTVGLNRPAKRNALNDGIILAIQDCFSNLPEGTGAVVIHGVGDHFSSGLDLSELTEHDAPEGLRHSQMWHRVFDRIQSPMHDWPSTPPPPASPRCDWSRPPPALPMANC